MLVILVPDGRLPAVDRLPELKTRIDFVKELGGSCRGLFQNVGLVCEFPDRLFNEWTATLGLLHFS